METKHLITIGQLAKISDVHVKALRYYERIGLLPPTYVNPENGYRYFSHTHVYLIEVIRLWTDLQLPLKTLKEFVSTDGVQVELTNLIDFATKAAIEKIAEMKEKVTLLTEIKTEIQRSEEIKKREVVHTLEIPEAHFWLVPYEGNIGDIAYHQNMAAAYDTIVSHQLRNQTFKKQVPSFQTFCVHQNLASCSKRNFFQKSLMLMPSVMRFVVRYKKRFVCQPFLLLMCIPYKSTFRHHKSRSSLE